MSRRAPPIRTRRVTGMARASPQKMKPGAQRLSPTMSSCCSIAISARVSLASRRRCEQGTPAVWGALKLPAGLRLARRRLPQAALFPHTLRPSSGNLWFHASFNKVLAQHVPGNHSEMPHGNSSSSAPSYKPPLRVLGHAIRILRGARPLVAFEFFQTQLQLSSSRVFRLAVPFQ